MEKEFIINAGERVVFNLKAESEMEAMVKAMFLHYGFSIKEQQNDNGNFEFGFYGEEPILIRRTVCKKGKEYNYYIGTVPESTKFKSWFCEEGKVLPNGVETYSGARKLPEIKEYIENNLHRVGILERYEK